MIPTPNVDAILALRPGAAWAMWNDDLTTLVWKDQTQTQPTSAEIAAEVQRQASVGPVPPSITRRQFFQQLSVQSIISRSDVVNALRIGAIPTPLQNLINGMPADKQFSATALIEGEAIFRRTHPLVATIGGAFGWNTTQIDQFFQAANLL